MSYYYAHSSDHQKKEVGYHTVNLDYLATLKSKFNNHSIWSSEKIQTALEFILNDNNAHDTTQNTPYGTMLPDITRAHILQEFTNESSQDIQSLLSEGINQHFDFEQGFLSKNAIDSTFQSAQVYKFTELNNYSLSLKKPLPH